MVLTYYWDGSAPEGRRLRNISLTGAYIITAERWCVGTIIRLIIQGQQRTRRADGTIAPVASTCVPARVVRQEPDGVAVDFVFRTKQEQKSFKSFLAAIVNCPAGNALPDAGSAKGQALVEFALILPLLFLLIVNAVNFGGFFFAWITVANAARVGAQYMSMGSDTPATAAQITALVANDVSSLLNRASLKVRVCTNNNGVVTCQGTGSGATPADPEPLSYTLGTVDVTYTYQPFIPVFDFSKLGIHVTLPATTIHQKSVMRMIQ
jgi:hypothetical protein